MLPDACLYPSSGDREMGLLELLGLPPSPAFAKTTSPRREAAAVVADAALADMEDPVRADGPVSRAVAEWQSLTIEPIVSAIKSGHSLRLRAMAQDAEGLDLTEINHEVDWSSSDRTAITVDATGLATALPVSRRRCHHGEASWRIAGGEPRSDGGIRAGARPAGPQKDRAVARVVSGHGRPGRLVEGDGHLLRRAARRRHQARLLDHPAAGPARVRCRDGLRAAAWCRHVQAGGDAERRSQQRGHRHRQGPVAAAEAAGVAREGRLQAEPFDGPQSGGRSGAAASWPSRP